VRLLEVLNFRSILLGQLLKSDHLAKGLRHIDRAGNELPGTDGASVLQLDTRGAVVLDDNALDMRPRPELATGLDERFHEASRQADAAADADFVAGRLVETADQRAHRAAAGNLVVEHRAEKRQLEQQQQLNHLVFEEIPDGIERLLVDYREEVATDLALGEQIVALRFRQRLGISLEPEYVVIDPVCAPFPVPVGLGIALREARDRTDGLLDVTG